MKSPDGLQPTRRLLERMRVRYQLLKDGSDSRKAIRPSTGAAKLAPRLMAVNRLSGGR
jgi:hypothetical protein